MQHQSEGGHTLADSQINVPMNIHMYIHTKVLSTLVDLTNVVQKYSEHTSAFPPLPP